VRSFPFWRVDVFAARPLEGNALAVFPQPGDLNDAEMLAIAREMNISETTFLQRATLEGAAYRNRIFTPGGELPIAGHPTLGSAFVAAEEGLIVKSDGVVSAHQQDGLGLTPVKLDIEGGAVKRVAMTQARPKFGRRFAKVDALAKALGVKPRDIKGTGMVPQVTSTGIPSLQVPLASSEAVRGLDPDLRALGKVVRGVSADPGVYCFALLDGTEADVHARGFFPLQGVPEDPATGSAAGACGAFLGSQGRLPTKQWFAIKQGAEIHHPSRIEVAVAVERGRPVQVRVAGAVQKVMQGVLELPQ
jgi:trans-2,3-dihydro-3-hydroxyanthranilate isomerase